MQTTAVEKVLSSI